MDDYEFAKRLADVAHHKQRYGTNPYTHHLQAVEEILYRFGFDDYELKIAAWLHDIIEDTELSYDQVKHGFGERIANIVYAVTNEMGRNRKERYGKTYPKIKADRKALILKLADRIANIEQAIGTNSRYVDLYRKEWEEFYSQLFEDVEDQRVIKMWKYLESLFGGENGKNYSGRPDQADK
jgi:(p)ppGpp synthase/HD superfamily hydrolase